MPKRPGLTEQGVIDAATKIVDEEGLEVLTIATLAARLKVRPPSLYNHLYSLDSLKRDVALGALQGLLGEVQRAALGRAGKAALLRVAHAYRAYARAHPGLYLLTLRPDDEPQLAAVGAELVGVVLAVLRAYGLEGDAALHATRALRSALHGFVSLELAGGFGLPLSLDESFAGLLELIDGGLRVTREKGDSQAAPDATETL